MGGTTDARIMTHSALPLSTGLPGRLPTSPRILWPGQRTEVSSYLMGPYCHGDKMWKQAVGRGESSRQAEGRDCRVKLR